MYKQVTWWRWTCPCQKGDLLFLEPDVGDVGWFSP